MSSFNKFSNNDNNCCRNCSGNICATYAIIDVSSGGNSFSLKGIDGPNVDKSCDKALKEDADVKLDFELGNKLYDTVKQHIENLVSVGFYLENGRIFKGCASFEAKVCVENGEAGVEISSFNMHTFA